MKKIDYLKKITHSTIIAVLILTQFGCEEVNGDALLPDEIENTYNSVDQNLSSLQTGNFPYEELSDEEIKGLLFMREEEKLARDTYILFYDLFKQPNFSNISRSEQVHMDAILYLLDKYQLDDPAEGNDIGVFVNTELQQLFNELQETGSTDRIAALKVGALIEETDILDIQHELDHTVDNQDVRFVYENLIRGSKNHLRSFVGVLRVSGVEYEPVLLDEEVFQEIINR